MNFTTTLTDSKMKANQPYAIKVASAFTATAINGVTIVEEDTPTQHATNWDFVGTYTNGNIPQNSYFFSSNKLWQAEDETNTIAPFRAYFTYTGGVAARNVNFVIDGETTGIANVNVNDNDNFDNAPMYNLAGQRVTKSYKGVIIVNGKKVLNKYKSQELEN